MSTHIILTDEQLAHFDDINIACQCCTQIDGHSITLGDLVATVRYHQRRATRAIVQRERLLSSVRRLGLVLRGPGNDGLPIGLGELRAVVLEVEAEKLSDRPLPDAPDVGDTTNDADLDLDIIHGAEAKGLAAASRRVLKRRAGEETEDKDG